MINFITEQPELFIALIILIITAVSAAVLIRSHKENYKKILRANKILLNRIQEIENTHISSSSSLTNILTSNMDAADMRIRESSEGLRSIVGDTASILHEIRENSLKEQLSIRQTVEKQLSEIRSANDQKLQEIERLVDDKLQHTLNSRISDSFKQVSDQLERVYRSLGEMQTLAINVGDLKKVLQNVTVRGAWGERRLEAILKENLAPSQYLNNTPVFPDSMERVEFAIILPGKGDNTVLLPVDSKFPQADYERITTAYESGDKKELENARNLLSQAVLAEGKRIASKYIKPPYTTDFAIMFLPTEGLFAEVVSKEGLADDLQRRYRIIPAGPTTFSALITSLQIGFRTIAIEQRSLEVWKLLGKIRSDFSSFGISIDAVRKRLEQASGELDSVSAKSRSISRHLNDADKYDLEYPNQVDPVGVDDSYIKKENKE